MAELVLSAFLSVLFEKLASASLEKLAHYKGFNAKIKKWQRWLNQIHDLLTDASHKEITSQSVKRWLNDLQHLAYDIDDVLDELATEAMHREFIRESEGITDKVRKLIPTCCTNFSQSTRMHDKLDNITIKLQDLVEEKATLGLRMEEATRSININRRLQTSMVHASSIVGRKAEKEALIHKLLGDESCDKNFSIVPIVGMGGVGKTTLARLLYDEERVKDHFELKAWVCVSDEFDNFGISKVIFQSIAGKNIEFADLNLLQVALRDHLREKRFLLVLDDVWSESCEDWETLVGPFHACASGSKIIMTTQKDKLLKKLGCNHLNQQLQCLSDEDALSLVSLHALGVNTFDSHLSLKPYGEGIVKKCDGLPLALIALGRLLRSKKDEDSRKEVLESEIWRSKDGVIIPALRVSYHDLPACLKQLFSYCSLFPKDCVFDKEELVLLWMAEGFLHQSSPKDSSKESIGREYFDELLSRSFFQHAPNHESLFVMHDMMNDLATSVASEFFVRLDIEARDDIGKEMLEKYHHMSFVREKYVTYKKLKTFERATNLRTFMATSIGVVERKVPDSIGTLRHLRYLNLSRTKIACLPENLCNLYNLETLIVSDCRRLAKLPKNFLRLKSMRHLDIRGTPLLDQMPLGIGELKSLQTLSKIILEDESRFEITTLRELKDLCGKISIVGLEKVQSEIHARVVNFSQKRLSELEVEWSDAFDGSRNEMLEKKVLNELKPRNDYLKQLKIRSYGGLEFPVWVGDPLFLQLKHVSISGCKKCTSLPPLGQLPSLKELFIEGLDGVKVVDMELLGTSPAFPSLEILSYVDMRGWKEWSTNNGVVFPCLRKLIIRNCPDLVEVTLEALPSMNVLEIDCCDCGVLKTLVQVASAISKLEIVRISGLNDSVWRGIIEYLGVVEDLTISFCNEIRYLWESKAVASKVLMKLRNLGVCGCDNLVSLEENEEEMDNCRSNLLTSLRKLMVSTCKNMERCSCPDSIEVLFLIGCSSLATISLPTGVQKLKSFDIRYCNKLLESEWGVTQMNSSSSSSSSNSIPMLESVYILEWQNLKSIIELKYFDHLTTLRIESCESLESFPDSELPKLASLKYLTITNCPSIDACFPRGFWPPKLSCLEIGKLKKPISEWGGQNFPSSLVELYLYGEDGVSSCSEFSTLLPSSLTALQIYEFMKLESVSMGLQHLGFNNCPNMMDLPEELLPSLLRLNIFYCPKLGDYWPLISHIPLVDNQYKPSIMKLL